MKYDLRSMNKSKNDIKAVVFDIGGVLIENPWESMMCHYAKTLQIDIKKLDTAIREIYDDFDKNIISEENVWKHVMDLYNKKQQTIRGLWIEGVTLAYQEKKEMMLLAKKLKNKGYKVGILSNTEHPTAPFLQHRFKLHFHTVILSSEVGLAKPQKEIYEHTLIKLQTLPHETVFIDDKIENIEGAKKAGMHAIHYTTHEAFLEQFSHYVKLG